MFPCGKFRALILKYIRGENSCWQGIGECKTSFLNKQQKNVQEHCELSPSIEGLQVSLDKSGQRASVFKDCVDSLQRD